MGKVFNKALKLIFLFFASFAVGAISYSLWVISDLPLHNLEHNQKDTNALLPPYEIRFEDGASTEREQLRSFVEIVEVVENEEQLVELLDLSESAKVSFQNDIIVKAGLQNHCPLKYCFQRRLEFEEIPSLFWKTLIGVEDVRFLEHAGIDPKSILRALITDIIEMKFVQGGSTLTQQLVKNLYLSNEKKLIRKIKEMIAAVYIEAMYDKSLILQAYLNEVFWGSFQGIKIKGIHAASIFYFFKKPNFLTEYEVAILISLLKGPYFYHPIKYGERLRGRANVLYALLKEKNFISQYDDSKWNDKKWQVWLEDLQRKHKEQNYRHLLVSQYNNNNLFNVFENYVFTKNAYKQKKELQKKLKEIHGEDAKKIDLAVKAFFFDIGDRNQSFSFYSKPERGIDPAVKKEFHQVGSALKPLVYHILANHGVEMDREVSLEPFTLKIKSGSWTPRDHAKVKSATFRDALKKSYNRPLIKLSAEIGFAEIENELSRIIPRLQKPLAEYPAQLLGAVELSLYELADAYLYFFKKQCASWRLGEEERDLPLFVLSDPSKTTIRFRAGDIMELYRFFGKTGTSNKGFDNWFISFQGQHIGVIWVGHEGDRNIMDTKLFGGSAAFPIFKEFYLNRARRFVDLDCEA